MSALLTTSFVGLCLYCSVMFIIRGMARADEDDGE